MSHEGTTEIIRRKTRHWKMILGSVATVASPILVVCFPQHAEKIVLICSSLTGPLLLDRATKPAPDAPQNH